MVPGMVVMASVKDGWMGVSGMMELMEVQTSFYNKVICEKKGT
jgi:hypothetical protein